MDTTPYSVLVILEEESIRLGLARELKKCARCAKIDSTPSVDAGLLLLENTGYDVVFCEVDFRNGIDGEAFLDAVVATFPATAVVMISGSFDPRQSLQLILRGAQYCLQLPLFKAHCEVVLANLNFSADFASLTSAKNPIASANISQDRPNADQSKRVLQPTASNTL